MLIEKTKYLRAQNLVTYNYTCHQPRPNKKISVKPLTLVN